MRKLGRYDGDRISRGFIHFFLGKGASSLAGLGLLAILVRHLPIDEFATYTVLQALVEVFTALSGFGLTHATLRYLPELYVKHENLVFRGFVKFVIASRVFTLTIAVILVFITAETLATWLGLERWVDVFRIYLVVVWLRVNGHFFFQILESTLHQGLAQSAFVITTLTKFSIVFWFSLTGSLCLDNVIKAEILGEFVGFLLLSFGVLRVVLETKVEPMMTTLSSWFTTNGKRVAFYGLTGYAQHLAILPYGSAPNRMLAGRLLDVFSLAAFGFAQSFSDVIRRYLPAQLLGGLIRPVMIARFAREGNFQNVADVLNFVFKVNNFAIGFLAAVFFAGGPTFVKALSNGKYGTEAFLLLLLMIAVLVLESRRFLLDIAVQTIERNKVLISGNLLLSMFVVFPILLIPYIGAAAIPFSAAVGLALSNRWVSGVIASEGFAMKFNYKELIRTSITAVLAGGVGSLASVLAGSWMLGSSLAIFVYLIAGFLFKAITLDDISKVKSLRHSRRTN